MDRFGKLVARPFANFASSDINSNLSSKPDRKALVGGPGDLPATDVEPVLHIWGLLHHLGTLYNAEVVRTIANTVSDMSKRSGCPIPDLLVLWINEVARLSGIANLDPHLGRR